jgi:hypothetical protein
MPRPNSYTKDYAFPHLSRSAEDPDVYFGHLDKKGRLCFGNSIAGSCVLIKWRESKEGVHAHFEVFIDNPIRARAERKKK